jgi:hypothetical protein
MRGLRVLVGVAGLAFTGVGAWLLLTGGRTTDPLSVLTFLALPVAAHDAVLAPVAVLLGWLALRFAPRPAHAPLQVALLMVASVLLVGLPLVLVQALGRRPADNPSVDPLDYQRNVVVLVLLLVAGAAAAVAVRAVQARRATKARPPSDQESSTR